MAEHHISLAASSALDVHEVRVGGGHQSLELVGVSFLFEGGVQEVSVHRLLIILMDNIYALFASYFYSCLDLHALQTSPRTVILFIEHC